LRQEQPALRSAELELEVLQGPDGDQGLRLIRRSGGVADVEVVINRSRCSSLALFPHNDIKILWPPQRMGAELPKQLEPQSAVALALF